MIAKFKSVVRQLKTGPINIVKSGKSAMSAITNYTFSRKIDAVNDSCPPNEPLIHRQYDTYEIDLAKSRMRVSKSSFL